MNLNDYRTEPALENAGRWVQFEDAKFLIASHNNPRYRALTQKLARTKYGAALRKQDVTAQEKITIEAMAHTILLGWEGVFDGDKEVKFSTENAEKLLSIPSIREFVSIESQNVANFQAEAEKADTDAIKSGSAVAPAVGGEPGISDGHSGVRGQPV